ncbi:M48 family metallopeptidase [Derxia lacustris]|uniref:M48 family metallopeptidase n=1 Tax=Derxia lacustris TaxID=764842 RepID=UPI000A177D6B|nr:SprT family zinc-dependent metalloprotease [Derxia lacustris]
MNWLSGGVRQADLFGGPPRARRPVEEARSRSLACADGPLQYRLRRSRRRTIGFRVDDSGLTVSAPSWLSLAEIETAVASKLPWIRRTLASWTSRSAAAPHIDWRAGSVLPWLGGQIRIALDPRERKPRLLLAEPPAAPACMQPVGLPPETTPDLLALPLPPDAPAETVREAAHAWLRSDAERVFAERLALLAPRLDLAVGRWRLSSARRRWGSCSADGGIRLNWRLVLFPMRVIDYVIVHELAHRHEMNHGTRFWTLVATVQPDWRLAEQWLKTEAPKLLGRSFD